jgi:cell wall-associated NlpC family hydrolase
MSVYQAFGYSLPRSSYAQASSGKAVSYSEAQPGDIIYYGGHVGIYIGGGQIVHASTERTGIKITSATYRSIITVRRIV